MAHPLETEELTPTPGVSIMADVMAGSSPAYVYLHGMSSTRASEKSDALCERARSRGRAFARFDFRGHGDSSGSMTDLTLTELIEDTTTVLHHMGPSLLVGSSLGGLVAAWTAAKNPDVVAGLTMLSPALGFLPEMARSHEEGTTVDLQDSGGEDLVFSPRALQDARHYDEATLPQQLSMPILIVHGELDDAVPYQLSQRFFEAIPHDRASFWLVPGGDHGLNLAIGKIYDRMDGLMDG